MAKVKFKEYLRRKKNSGPIYESEEGLMKRAKERIEADALIVQPDFRVENFMKAAELLEQAGDYPGAKELREECLEKVKEAKKEKHEADYKRAVMHYTEADNEEDLIKSSAELKKLKGYKDSRELKAEADARVAHFRKSYRIKQCVVLGLIIVMAIACWWIVRVGLFSYAVAWLEGKGRMYESALNRFDDLGGLLDSEEQAEHYRILIQKQKEKTEGSSLKKAHRGDKVSFAGYNWVVLDRKESTRLLLCETRKEDSLYGLAYHDLAEAVTWEASSLRAYLNGEFLDRFTDYERNGMLGMETVPGKNEDYGRDGGTAVHDLIRILSLEEAEKYQKIFEKPNADMWLCTPGHSMETAAYMTKSGIIMPYGMDVASDRLSACPVILVDVRQLAQDKDAADTEDSEAADMQDSKTVDTQDEDAADAEDSEAVDAQSSGSEPESGM